MSAGTATYKVLVDTFASSSVAPSQQSIANDAGDAGDLVGQEKLISSWMVAGRNNEPSNSVWWTKSGALKTVYSKPGSPTIVKKETTKTTKIEVDPITYADDGTSYVVLLPILLVGPINKPATTISNEQISCTAE